MIRLLTSDGRDVAIVSQDFLDRLRELGLCDYIDGLEYVEDTRIVLEETEYHEFGGF